ncbi:unnamed protein product, partial [Timema podura]|nr:unnamed protein product [Timema podura]
KVYQTSRGYFVVTPEKRRRDSHSNRHRRHSRSGNPTSSLSMSATRGEESQHRSRLLLMSTDEAMALVHGEMQTIRDGEITHQAVQTNLADVICGVNVDSDSSLLNILAESTAMDLRSGKTVLAPGSPENSSPTASSTRHQSDSPLDRRTPPQDLSFIAQGEATTTPSRVRSYSPVVSPIKQVHFRKDQQEEAMPREDQLQLMVALQELTQTQDGRAAPRPAASFPTKEPWALLLPPDAPLLDVEENVALCVALALKAKAMGLPPERDRHQVNFILSVASAYPDLPDNIRQIIVHRINTQHIALTKGWPTAIASSGGDVGAAIYPAGFIPPPPTAAPVYIPPPLRGVGDGSFNTSHHIAEAGQTIARNLAHKNKTSLPDIQELLRSPSDPNDKIMYARITKRSSSFPISGHIERRHSLRLFGSSKRLSSSLTRCGSLKHISNKHSVPLTSDNASSTEDYNTECNHGKNVEKKTSLLSRLFRRSGRKRGLSAPPAPLVTFSAQFPPTEWFNPRVVHLHSIGTQTSGKSSNNLDSTQYYNFTMIRWWAGMEHLKLIFSPGQTKIHHYVLQLFPGDINATLQETLQLAWLLEIEVIL